MRPLRYCDIVILQSMEKIWYDIQIHQISKLGYDETWMMNVGYVYTTWCGDISIPGNHDMMKPWIWHLCIYVYKHSIQYWDIVIQWNLNIYFVCSGSKRHNLELRYSDLIVQFYCFHHVDHAYKESRHLGYPDIFHLLALKPTVSQKTVNYEILAHLDVYISNLSWFCAYIIHEEKTRSNHWVDVLQLVLEH